MLLPEVLQLYRTSFFYLVCAKWWLSLSLLFFPLSQGAPSAKRRFNDSTFDFVNIQLTFHYTFHLATISKLFTAKYECRLMSPVLSSSLKLQNWSKEAVVQLLMYFIWYFSGSNNSQVSWKWTSKFSFQMVHIQPNITWKMTIKIKNLICFSQFHTWMNLIFIILKYRLAITPNLYRGWNWDFVINKLQRSLISWSSSF
jgi:hypothetical protein